MISFSGIWRLRIGFITVVTSTLVALNGQTFAADPPKAQGDSEKTEASAGKLILLDEPEKVAVAPTIVTKETIREKLGDGRVEREVAHYSDNSFAADGSYKEFHPNGKPFIEGQFRKGRQDGEWKYYFDNGQLNRKATFKDGKPNGSWEINRADGTLQGKRGFKDGMRDGEWITYDDTGKKPRLEEHYIAGNEDGVWKTWFPNGQQRQQISYKNGKRNGALIEWDDKGQKVLELEFVDNKITGTATRSLPDGRKIVQKYDNGRLVSESKQ